MIRNTILALLVAITCCGGVAQAQSGKGPNGGTVATSQGHDIEMVLKGTVLTFYLFDDDTSPLATKGIQARAIVQVGGKTSTVQLQPSAPNLMVGNLQETLPAKTRVVFSATFRVGSHNHTLTARFEAP